MTRGKPIVAGEDGKAVADRYRSAAFQLCDAASKLKVTAALLRATKVRVSPKAADDIIAALAIIDELRAGHLFAAPTATVDTRRVVEI